LFVGH